MKLHGPALAVFAALTLAACHGGSAIKPDAGEDRRQADHGFYDLVARRDLTCTGSLPADVPDGGLELPRPTGPYGVGTELRVLVDSARDEPATADPTDKRKIAVRLFYPTDPCPAGAPASLMARGEAKAAGVTIWAFKDWPSDKPWEQLVVMHARANVPLAAAGRFPAVLSSHGYTGLRDFGVSYLEDLASWGFIVAAISHTYDSAAVVFPDGSEADLDPSCWSHGPTDADFDAHTAVWLADARFVADQLAAWNASDTSGRLTGRIDLDQLGMFGGSYGGAIAGEACFADARFKAGANLDGTFYSPARTTGGRTVNQPFMIQLSADHVGDPSIDNFFDKLQVGYEVRLANSTHMSFGDAEIIVKQIFGADVATNWFGSGDYLRTLLVSRAYNLAFFKKHLRKDPQPLLDGPSPEFPEATLSKKP
jgi:dienelactone hydrolase